MSPTSAEIVLPIDLLHPGQRAVAEHKARFRVLAAGRRWGKTRLAAFLCVMNALRGQRVWWVGPSYPMAQIGWREIKHLAWQVGSIFMKEPSVRVQPGQHHRPLHLAVQHPVPIVQRHVHQVLRPARLPTRPA
jgi:hypothetical protein